MKNPLKKSGSIIKFNEKDVMRSPTPFLSNTSFRVYQLIVKKIKLDLSLTIYSTDRTIHVKSVLLAIRTNLLSRLSYLGARI